MEAGMNTIRHRHRTRQTCAGGSLRHQLRTRAADYRHTERRPARRHPRIINGCTFSYTRQTEMKGLGHAILTGETLIGREPFGVILADDLCVGGTTACSARWRSIYAKYRCSIVAIEEVPQDEVHKYGVIAGSELEDGVYVVSGHGGENPPRRMHRRTWRSSGAIS